MADFIGSHISLISKSDIKYLGVLHSIDPVEATVSLEKVRSLGTQGRKSNPAEEIPPNDNVYDFVVFRAADVKDLQIEAPPAAAPSQAPISDPAVVATNAAPPAPAASTPETPQTSQPQLSPQQSSNQPPQAVSAQQGGLDQPTPQQQQGFGPPGGQQGQFPPYPPYGPLGGYGPPPGPPGQGFYGYGGPPPRNFGGPGGFGPPGPGGFGPPMGYPNQFGPPPPQHQQQLPSPPQHQQQQQQQQSVKSVTDGPAATSSPAVQNAVVPQPAVDSKTAPSKAAETAQVSQAAEANKPAPTAAAPAVDAAASKARSYANLGGAVPTPASDGQKRTADESVAKLTDDMSRSNLEGGATKQAQSGGARNAGAPQQTQQQQGANRSGRGPGGRGGRVAGTDFVGGSVFSNNASNHQNPNQGNRRGSANGPGTGLGAGRALQPFGRPTAHVDVPLTDFDFESSNAAFSKDKVLAEGEEDEEVVIPKANDSFYDKKSSFFDSISSDIKTRAEGGMVNSGFTSGGRFDRDKERSKNMEAFGESGAGMGFGGRGRGRGRGGRGRGGGYHRGGYNRGGPRQNLSGGAHGAGI